MTSSAKRVFVVTGANKGIGYATVKAICDIAGSDIVIYLTARSIERGTQAVDQLKKLGHKPLFHPLDVEDSSSIKTFADYIKKEHGGLDVLVNNAGFAYKQTATESFAEQAEGTIRINYFGLQAVCHALFPLLRSNSRVVNVSSCMGHLSKVPGKELRARFADTHLKESKLDDLMNEFKEATKTDSHSAAGWPSSTYIVSKVGVSALSRIQQRLFDADDTRTNILINHCHPGYVDTDMTSHKGVLTTEQGAVCPTYLALLPPSVKGPKGEFLWHDKQIVDWVNGPMPAPY